MWKKHKIVVLPTYKGSKLHFDKIENIYHYTNNEIHYCNRIVESKSLFVISDEEIKEGDWVYALDTNSILQFKHKTGLDLYKKSGSKVLGKIIASTDKSISLPSPTDEFLKEWVNNPIDIIKVEYEAEWDDDYQGYYADSICLKVENNTINCIFIQTESEATHRWDDICDKYNEYLNHNRLNGKNTKN